MAARLLIFARSPELGRVKSRLARSVGQRRALAVYLQLLDRTLKTAAASGLDWELWVAGDCRQADLQRLAGNLGIAPLPQPAGELGDRLDSAFKQRLEGGPVMVIGSDCPQLTPRHLQVAARALERPEQVVLGPAEDGGYYLVGLRCAVPGLFSNIPWGTGEVLEKTVAAAQSQHKPLKLLPRLRDLDTVADLEWAMAEKLVD